jgi:hypothetical protein
MINSSARSGKGRPGGNEAGRELRAFTGEDEDVFSVEFWKSRFICDTSGRQPAGSSELLGWHR